MYEIKFISKKCMYVYNIYVISTCTEVSNKNSEFETLKMYFVEIFFLG